MAEKPQTRGQTKKVTLEDIFTILVASENRVNERLTKIENDQKQLMGGSRPRRVSPTKWLQ